MAKGREMSSMSIRSNQVAPEPPSSDVTSADLAERSVVSTTSLTSNSARQKENCTHITYRDEVDKRPTKSLEHLPSITDWELVYEEEDFFQGDDDPWAGPARRTTTAPRFRRPRRAEKTKQKKVKKMNKPLVAGRIKGQPFGLEARGDRQACMLKKNAEPRGAHVATCRSARPRDLSIIVLALASQLHYNVSSRHVRLLDARPSALPSGTPLRGAATKLGRCQHAATGANDGKWFAQECSYDYSKSTSENYADSHARTPRVLLDALRPRLQVPRPLPLERAGAAGQHHTQHALV